MSVPVTMKPRLTSAFKQLWSLHWVMVICFLLLYTAGAFMSRLPNNVSFRDNLFDFHKSVGALVIGLLMFRIFLLLQVFWRKYTSRHPRMTQRWVQMVILHTVLYVLMLGVPLSGFLYSNSGDHDVVFLGLITLPRLFGVNPDIFELAHQLHFWLAYTFLALIVLHAFEQRQFFRTVWRRLTP